MQEQLAKYMHDNNPLGDEDSRWESLSQADRDLYRVWAYLAISYFRETTFLPPVMPRWWEREAS